MSLRQAGILAHRCRCFSSMTRGKSLASLQNDSGSPRARLPSGSSLHRAHTPPSQRATGGSQCRKEKSQSSTTGFLLRIERQKGTGNSHFQYCPPFFRSQVRSSVQFIPSSTGRRLLVSTFGTAPRAPSTKSDTQDDFFKSSSRHGSTRRGSEAVESWQYVSTIPRLCRSYAYRNDRRLLRRRNRSLAELRRGSVPKFAVRVFTICDIPDGTPFSIETGGNDGSRDVGKARGAYSVRSG